MATILLICLIGISPVFGFINGPSESSDVEGCLRGGIYYASGATVPSEELCENCACNAGEITCTVQKCRAPRTNCRPMGFIKGTCCPLKYECEDEINQLVPEIPFTNSDVKRFRNTPSAKSCSSNGQRYLSGQSVPVFSPCQTSCACVDGSIACTQSACQPAPPAFLKCTKLQVLNECCPEYDCSSTRNTLQTLKCEHKGVSYEDGDFVPNSDQCSECFCLDGEVVCANQECPNPPADNCTPVTSSHQECCPQKYECFDVPPQEIDTVETPLTTEGPIEDKEPTTTNEELASTDVEATDAITKAPVTENDNTMATVTENNMEVDKEKVTTTVVEDFTTPEPVTTTSIENDFTTVANNKEHTEYFTETEQTTISDVENESTTIENLNKKPVESTSSSTSIDLTTMDSVTDEYIIEHGYTTFRPLEVTSSTSVITEETTIDSSTDCPDCVTETVTDTVSTESSTDYSTVTEDEMDTETTTIAFVDMCSNNGNIYSDGDSIPLTSQCQESCQCRNGTVTCIEKACSSAPPAFLRCASIEVVDESDECCPKYDCPPSTPGPESPECVKDGIQYYEGEFVPSVDLCTDCYCMYGEVLCAFLECSPPVRDTCTPIYDEEKGTCCPEYYECDIEGDIQTTTQYETETTDAPANLSLLRFWLN